VEDPQRKARVTTAGLVKNPNVLKLRFFVSEATVEHLCVFWMVMGLQVVDEG
jgi:hypothetical protein